MRDIAIVGAAGGEFGIRGYHRRHRPQHRQAGSGAPTRFRAPANPATKPGRTARSAGSTAAARSGKPRPTTRRPTRSTRASAMPVPTTTSNTGRATTSGPRACSRCRRRDGKIKWGFQYTPERPVRLRRNLRAPDHQRQGQRRGPQARRARGAQRLLLRARPRQRLVRVRQAVCRRADLDHRARSEDRQAAQLRSDQGRAGLHARQPRHAAPPGTAIRCLPVALRRQELAARRLQSRPQPALHPVDRRLQHRITTVEQKELRRPGRHREAARALRRRRQQKPADSATAPSRRSTR